MKNDLTGRPRQRGHRIVGPLAEKDFTRHWAFSTAAIVTIAITTALSIAAAAVQYMQQQQAAQTAAENQKRALETDRANQEAQMRAQDAAIAANAALANKAYMEDTKALQAQQRQADEVAAGQQREVGLKTAQAKSTALTAAGEAGVSGLNVNALISDFTRQEADYRFQSTTELTNQRDQTVSELKAAQIKAEGRTQDLKPFQTTQRSPNAIEYPSLLGAGLRVAGNVGSSLANRARTTPQTPPNQTYSPSWT